MSLPAAMRNHAELDHWLGVNEDGTITVRTGKVEIGQGISTALAMIAAEELGVAMARIRVQTADTEITPNEGVTSGSQSVEDSGRAVRIASATAREILLALGAELLDVPADSLLVEDGLISSSDSNEQTDYWSLQAGHAFHITILDAPAFKDLHSYEIVGHRQQRLDLEAKVRGDVAFVHDMELPHMRHGRLVKPPTPHARLLQLPSDVGMPGIEVVVDGSFVGVLAEREEQAIAAAQRLAGLCQWSEDSIGVSSAELYKYLRDNVTQSLPVVNGTPVEEAVVAPAEPAAAATTLRETYLRPYQMHAAMGPSAALAQFSNGLLTVYCHSQGVELVKLALADVLGLPEDQVHVIHAEGAGCYGHNGADDVALDAALLAMAAEPDPVSVKWTRADEHGFEPYGPAAVLDLQASLGGDGKIIDWRHEVYSFSHIGRPRPLAGYTNMQTAWWIEQAREPAPRRPIKLPEVGIHRNLEPIYTLPREHLVEHFVAESPLRTSSLRSLGAFANVFAIESFMDELAREAQVEPIQFRLRHLEDRRGRAVLNLLRDSLGAPLENSGRGIAFAQYKNRQTYCAIGVDVQVGDDASVQLVRCVIAADAGLVVDPDGLVNQLEGGFVQAASWTLKEAVTWEDAGVTSRDWESYPILTFSEVPEIETHLIRHLSEPPVGAGEASTGPTPAAIANAIYAASGVRVREIPFTPERLRAAATSD